jgi:hypothetical protein
MLGFTITDYVELIGLCTTSFISHCGGFVPQEDLLDDPWLAELARLLPELRDSLPLSEARGLHIARYLKMEWADSIIDVGRSSLTMTGIKVITRL